MDSCVVEEWAGKVLSRHLRTVDFHTALRVVCADQRSCPLGVTNLEGVHVRLPIAIAGNTVVTAAVADSEMTLACA